MDYYGRIQPGLRLGKHPGIVGAEQSQKEQQPVQVVEEHLALADLLAMQLERVPVVSHRISVAGLQEGDCSLQRVP